MDIHMPVMGGLEAIEHIMANDPTPILVVTSDPRANGEELNFEALRRGALDVISKPLAWEASASEKEKLRDHLKLLAEVAVVRHMRGSAFSQRAISRRRESAAIPVPPVCLDSVERESKEPKEVSTGTFAAKLFPSQRNPVVAIVASMGGPAALAQIFETLPRKFPAAVVVVQHIARGFAASLARWLNNVSSLPVRLAEEGADLEPGKAWLAPDGFHLIANSRGSLSLDFSPPLEGYRPSGSRLLSSVAQIYGRQAIGVILTGMGEDGVAGLAAIRDAGGMTIAQDATTSVVYGMPKAALEKGVAQMVLPLEQITSTLFRLVSPEGTDELSMKNVGRHHLRSK
jgi:two-component system chemotaxis response regulator CheB